MSTLKLEYARSSGRRRPWWFWLAVVVFAVVVAWGLVIVWYLTPGVAREIIVCVFLWYLLPLGAMMALPLGIMWLADPGTWSGLGGKIRRWRTVGSKPTDPGLSSNDL